MRIEGDKVFLILVVILTIVGFLIFVSASLGLLARESATPGRLLLTQTFFGIIPGVLAMILLRFFPHSKIEALVIPAYVVTLLLTVLVFVPGIGTTLNGATRWIDVFGITTVQPAEFLKIGVIMLLASYLAHAQKRLSSLKNGLLPYLLIVGIPLVVLLLQPNTSTAVVLALVSLLLFLLAGGKLRHAAFVLFIGAIALAGIVFMRPYVMDRILTFFDPSRDPLNSGYQIQQSLIAVGSGELMGRGFGQSIQKFSYLPEPVGDSIFAVYSEEFGFIGGILLLSLYLLFLQRAFAISATASSRFMTLLCVGLALSIVLSAFFNIAAMIGLMPLSGLPLPFVSHGGSALLAVFISAGLILNIAAHKAK
jgi:cell division protein FtsW